ncbi:MAG: metal ABC transporter ATP-binding protein, partial [Synechococcales bacterium]|nr:metal ABC transporter ATP-binding protein [Synechococcales bacterium]
MLNALPFQSDAGDRPAADPTLAPATGYTAHAKGWFTPSPPDSSIQVNHLNVYYRTVAALQNVSLTIEPGHLVGIFGPNGAGKSTLMKAMLGLVPATTGTVTLAGKPLAEQLERIAYVPQRSQIDWTFPATVWDVVLMGRVKKAGLLSRLSVVSRRLAAGALERVGMAAYRDRPIGDLSGGQQQRVFLARSLAQEADIFFFDEPFSGIDQTTEDVLFQIFHELAAAGKTVLVVNHDLGESITHFDRLILLNRELIATGPREQVLTPAAMARAYGSHVNFFAHQA